MTEDEKKAIKEYSKAEGMIKEFLKAKDELCGEYEACSDCPLWEEVCSNAKPGEDEIDKMIEIVTSYIESKKRTYYKDFLEKFPHTNRETFVGNICRNEVYFGCNKCDADDYCGIKTCQKCWNEPMPTEEEAGHAE